MPSYSWNIGESGIKEQQQLLWNCCSFVREVSWLLLLTILWIFNEHILFKKKTWRFKQYFLSIYTDWFNKLNKNFIIVVLSALNRIYNLDYAMTHICLDIVTFCIFETSEITRPMIMMMLRFVGMIQGVVSLVNIRKHTTLWITNPGLLRQSRFLHRFQVL